MIRIINLRVAVTVKSDIKSIVEKKYPQLRGAIETIHVVRRAVDARKKPNIVFVYTLFVEVHNEAQIMKKLSKQKDVSVFTAEDSQLQDKQNVVNAIEQYYDKVWEKGDLYQLYCKLR